MDTQHSTGLTTSSRKPIWGDIPVWVKSVIALSLTGVAVVKIYQTPIAFEFDFPSFLSLALAIFSVVIAVLFYFKATETSNAFYDNTYKFSQDVAALLAKIESGFGERLRHLDDSYKSMSESFVRFPDETSLTHAKKNLRDDEEQSKKLREERDALLERVISQSQLQEDEKKELRKRLVEKESALNAAQQEAAVLRSRIEEEQTQSLGRRRAKLEHFLNDTAFRDFSVHRVLPLLPSPSSQPSRTSLRLTFRNVLGNLPSGYRHDLQRYGLIDERDMLTDEGIAYFLNLQASQEPEE